MGDDDKATGDARHRQAHEILRERRAAAIERADDATSGILIGKQWCPFSNSEARELYLGTEQRAGLALSGGGIRSATISLGLAEALASRGRLYAFDMVSTVSGGGYFGSFFRALHVARGSQVNEQAIVTDRLALAEATMTSLPDQQYFRGEPGHSAFVAKGRTVKNPLWWLRENGRYLAPGGMSDYGFAVAYMVRNWASLILFTTALAFLAFGVLQITLLALAGHVPGFRGNWLPWLAQSRLYSPLFPILGTLAWVGVGIAGAYWLATPLSYARTPGKKSDGTGRSTLVAIVLFLALLFAAIGVAYVRGWLPSDTTARAWAIGLQISLASAFLSSWRSARRVNGNAIDFRREQTRLLANFSTIFIGVAAMTLIDWAALSLRLWLDGSNGGEGSGDIVRTGAISGALASGLSFLIAKLPDWFGGKATAIGRFLVAHSRQFAFVAASMILASIALLADLLAIKLLWHGPAWRTASPIEWTVFGPVLILVGIVTLMFARSLNFANLLALTPLYGSRLTRAFIGGSNVRRLDVTTRSEVTQGMEGDDIGLQAYMEAGGPAPLHLINVTRNRTTGGTARHDRIDVAHDDPLVRESIDDPRGRLASYESSLTLHDRHGDRMVFGPFGLRVGAEFYNWKDDLCDPPSLGLLCAISGASVGAGMGRMTSLGGAMAFTLANVRLGYWWPEQSRRRTGARGGAFGRILPGLACLARELLGHFGTQGHWFLSDGGHSENSGVLTLLERGCGFILACDNGQDEDFNFCDLEILIRTARTDIGMEVQVVDHDRFPKNFESIKEHFLNGAEGDWRTHARDKTNPGFALLLKASDIPRRVNGVWKRRRGGDVWLVWLKPKCFSGLPADIATYADVHPEFPQQSTGNQFFDEAQWESYRRLGFEMGRRLFAKRDPFDRFLPVLNPKPPM
jgi:hypothetical protein